MNDKKRQLNLPADQMIRAGATSGSEAGGSTSGADKGASIADRFSSYLFHDDDLRLAFDVALATRRPLLIEGPSGSGKSTSAEAVADHLGWRFYRQSITSRTEAESLLWTVDHVRRLADAQSGQTSKKLDIANYLSPGPLWWAFDPKSASTVFGRRATDLLDPAVRQSATQSDEDGEDDDDDDDDSDGDNGKERGPTPAVVLIDEIDAAHPDMPGDLLEPLGSLRFRVDIVGSDPPPSTSQRKKRSSASTARTPAGGEPVDLLVTAQPGAEPLIVLTSNQERDLAPALLRRCIRHHTTLPAASIYTTIAKEQVPSASNSALALLSAALVETDDPLQKTSIAGFVDAARAMTRLAVDPKSREGTRIIKLFHQRQRFESDQWS